MSSAVFVHIVTHNHADSIPFSLESLLEIKRQFPGLVDELVVRDCGSTDRTLLALQRFEKEVRVVPLRENLGFAAAQNLGVAEFLASDAQYFLCMNPDLVLVPSAIKELVAGIEQSTSFGMAAPKLLRTDSQMNKLEQAIIDAAGMYITNELRHLDRGSGERDLGHHDSPRRVFGGSGACLLLKRDCIEALGLRGKQYDSDLLQLYPQLAASSAERFPLFDEAFFAYREDADLAWRAQMMGWSCIYWPKSIGYHRRLVTPERRKELPAEINRLGVRNRFLLQLNNYSFDAPIDVWLWGILVRNLTVIFGVLISEQSSISAFADLMKLRRRALERRRLILARRKIANAWKWFRSEPYSESLE